MAEKVGRRCFIAVAVACAVLTIAFMSLLAVFIWREQLRLFGSSSISYRTQDVCTSLACAEAALSLKQNMDESVDPCTNFYEFACGNFKWRIPWTSASSDWSTKYSKRINIRVKRLLESNKTTNRGILKKLAARVRNLYSTCMTDKTDLEQIKEIIDALGLMPKYTQNWEAVTLETFVATAHRNAYPALFEMGMTLDAKNNSNYRYEILEPTLYAPAQVYMEKVGGQYRASYKKFLKDILATVYEDLNKKQSDSYLLRVVDDILNLETQLFKMLVEPEERRDPVKTYNLWTLAKLKKEASRFKWGKYFNETLVGTGVTLRDSDPLIVTTPKFFNEMDGLLQRFPGVQHKLAMIALVNFLTKIKDRLSSKYQTIFKTYEKNVMGSAKEQYRWEYCVSQVNTHMKNIVTRLYVEKYFKSESMNEIRDLMRRIRMAFALRLANNKWMDSQTKSVAQVKLDKLRGLLAYPDTIFNDTWMTQELKNLPAGNNFFPDTLSISRQLRVSELALLGKKVDKTSWSPFEVIVAPDAAYDPYSNKLYLKVGILMEPLFNKDYPKYLNYGGIGMVVGHEITHGFDDENRQRDANGNLNQWWSDNAISNFKKETTCFVDQYSAFSVKSGNKVANLNGKLTLGENIADNGGLNQAYQAYVSWKKENGEEARLPELMYTPEQLFFINYAQNWCSAATDAELVNIISGHHSPEQFRVLGVVSNMEEFQEAFQCKPGSQMNRKKKCTIWR